MNAVASDQSELLISYTDSQLAGKDKGELLTRVCSQRPGRCMRLKRDPFDFDFTVPYLRRQAQSADRDIGDEIALTDVGAHYISRFSLGLEKVT